MCYWDQQEIVFLIFSPYHWGIFATILSLMLSLFRYSELVKKWSYQVGIALSFFSGIMINDSAHHYIWHKNGGYSMEMMIRRRVKMMMIVIIMLIMMMMVTMTMTNILVIWETQGGHHTIWNGPTVRTPEAQWPFWASEFSTACEVMLIMMKMM